VNIPAASWAAAALVFLSVTFGAVGLALLIEFFQETRRRRSVVRQLQGIGALDASESREALMRGRAGDQPLWLQQLSASTPRIRDLGLLLEQAGSQTSLEALLLMCAGLGIAFGAAILILTRFWPMALLASAAGGYLPIWFLKRKRQKRIDAFESLLPDAIDLLGRAIRAGHPLAAGFQMVADELKDPIGTEFQRTFEEQRFGLPFDDAIIALADRVSLVDVRILVTAILIQREVGGNLAEVLDNLATIIRARFTIRRQLRVYTAQGRFSGYTLGVLPLIVGTLIYALNPGYMTLLFTHPIGKMLVFLAVVMQIVGFLWIRKIIDIEI
jgi:tight adherence protein B